jgi:hypothetical protein
VLNVVVSSMRLLAPEPEIPLSLDEMIYSVTSGALEDSGMSMSDIHGSFMAASDLYDGRAISTMTLTGSTGSFGKSEMRVCNDSLAALMLAAADVATGEAEAVIVGSWSKLSDASRNSIVGLAIEPAFGRALGYHPEAVVALRESFESGTATLVEPRPVAGMDLAVAMVLTRPGRTAAHLGRVLSFGASTGSYLVPRHPLLEPLAQSSARALSVAGIEKDALTAVWVAGLVGISDANVAAALEVDEALIRRAVDSQADLGYAAGLTALHHALAAGGGPALVVAGGGIGQENTFATVVEAG